MTYLAMDNCQYPSILGVLGNTSPRQRLQQDRTLLGVAPARRVTRGSTLDERGRGAVVSVPDVVLQLVLARSASDEDELLVEVHRRRVCTSAGIDLAV